MSLPQVIECDHCGYESDYETKRLSDIGDEGAWVCPACTIYNTTYHKPEGYATVLGYHRDLEVCYLYDTIRSKEIKMIDKIIGKALYTILYALVFFAFYVAFR